MKKILLVIYSLEKKGGSERVVCELANALCGFYNVEILTGPSDTFAYPLNEQVKVTSFKKKGVELLYSFKRYISLNSYDFVLINTMGKLTLGLLIFGLRHERLCSLEHTSFLNTGGKISFFLRKLFYKYLRHVVVLTEKDKACYRSFHNAVELIRNPTPFKLEKHTTSTANSTEIISVGSLVKVKGFDMLIRAWALVEHEDCEFFLNIYGEGEERESLEQIISELGLKRISLKGQVDNIDTIYRRAAFFVMSSRYEGLPMVLIESQSFGLPIVSFDCPFGPSEIIRDNVDGFLVEPDNIYVLAEKIKVLMYNLDKRKQFSENAIKASVRFDGDKIIKDWIRLIEND